MVQEPEIPSLMLCPGNFQKSQSGLPNLSYQQLVLWQLLPGRLSLWSDGPKTNRMTQVTVPVTVCLSPLQTIPRSSSRPTPLALPVILASVEHWHSCVTSSGGQLWRLTLVISSLPVLKTRQQTNPLLGFFAPCLSPAILGHTSPWTSLLAYPSLKVTQLS